MLLQFLQLEIILKEFLNNQPYIWVVGLFMNSGLCDLTYLSSHDDWLPSTFSNKDQAKLSFSLI